MVDDNPLEVQLKDLFFKQEFDAQKWNTHLNAFVEGVLRVVEQAFAMDLERHAPDLIQSPPMKAEKNRFKEFIIGELSRIEVVVEDFLKIKLRGAEYQNAQTYELLLQSLALNQLQLDAPHTAAKESLAAGEQAAEKSPH